MTRLPPSKPPFKPPPRQVATVRLSIDFPGAEGIWAVMEPVYEGERIARVIARARGDLFDGMLLDAGSLASEKRAK